MTKHRNEPDYACPVCFEYGWLKDYVKENSTKEGTCPSCQSSRQPLIHVSGLYEPFDNLISTYKPADGPPLVYGTPIVDLIQDDWEVFSERLVDRHRAGALLESIMHAGWDDDDGEPPLAASDPYVARHRTWAHDTLADVWQEFVERVKKDPSRELQFRDPEFDDFLFGEELLGRRTVTEPVGTVYYRARAGFVMREDGRLEPHSGAQIGAPPQESAHVGRANPKGKIVMYCADQETTAVAEIRPPRGEYVSVAEVRANRELKILDLATEPEWPNPFTDEAVNYEVEFAAILAAFAKELKKPLRYRDDLTDYIRLVQTDRITVTAELYNTSAFWNPLCRLWTTYRMTLQRTTVVSRDGLPPRFYQDAIKAATPFHTSPHAARHSSSPAQSPAA